MLLRCFHFAKAFNKGVKTGTHHQPEEECTLLPFTGMSEAIKLALRSEKEETFLTLEIPV